MTIIHVLRALGVASGVLLMVIAANAAPPHESRTAGERAAATDADEAGPRYYLFDDQSADYHPAGWMPDGRGLAQNERCDESPHSGRYCVRHLYKPGDATWAGIGWELDGRWTPGRQLNVFDKLKARPGDHVALRWWARSAGDAWLKFVTGGGQKDSVARPIGTKPEWTRLGPRWQQYQLDLTGCDLSGVVQAFAWFMERARCPAGVSGVQWDLDDLYYVKLREARAHAVSNQANVAGDFHLRRRFFHEKLAKLRWVDYSPSTGNPEAGQAATPDEIATDLKTLADNGFPPSCTGICTYGCVTRLGGDKIPEIARKLGFAGMILGVWSITDDSDETPVARHLAAEGLVDAICMGNEGLQFNRYSPSQLRDAVRRMRADTHLPVSTSDVIEQYGKPLLTDDREMDWVYPNVHPVFHDYSDPHKAAEWVDQTLIKLQLRTKLPILVHETGWPSHGLRRHTPESQRLFWESVLATKHRLAVFEAFEQSWKHEQYHGADIGSSWGWFTPDRQPKAVVSVLAIRLHSLQPRKNAN
jgi:exo-beta-1,3-glucanase (GH17 family)